jgi:iron complex transport system substrate-binding protein
MNKIFILAVGCIGMLFAAGQKESEAQSVTILDCNGKEETIILPIKRAVVFAPGSMLSVIKAMHAEDKVVGVLDSMTDLDTRYPVFSKLPSVGTTESPNFEAILSLHPDIVLVPYWISEEIEEKLESDIPVVRLNVGPPLTYKDEIEKLAAIFGEEENAKAFIDWYQGYVVAITERLEGLKEEDTPLVFDFYGGDWGMSAGPPYGTYGKENFWVGPMIEMAGGINISRELPGDWIIVDPEWVITQNPSIIIREAFSMVSGADIVGYAAEGFSGLAAIREEIISKSALESTDAVKNDQVYIVDGSLIQSEWFLGLQYLAKWCHPDLFPDLNPQTVHQEYLRMFQRIDYDLSAQGVFVYPQQSR